MKDLLNDDLRYAEFASFVGSSLFGAGGLGGTKASRISSLDGGVCRWLCCVAETV